MKEIEEDRATSKKIKKQRVERKLEQTKQLVIPDMSTLDYERQLKKLATRGGMGHKTSAVSLLWWTNRLVVVALFNAIASAKRDATEEANAKENAKKEARGDGPADKDSKKNKVLKASLDAKKFQNDDGFYDDKKPASKNKTLSSSTTLDTAAGGATKTSWKALQDDYLVDKGNNLSMKVSGNAVLSACTQRLIYSFKISIFRIGTRKAVAVIKIQIDFFQLCCHKYWDCCQSLNVHNTV